MKAGKFISTLSSGLYLTVRQRILRERIQLIDRSLSPLQLMYEPNEMEISEDLMGERNRFLNYYSEQGITLAMKRYGLVRKLKKLGFKDLVFDITVLNYTHTLSIYNAKKESGLLIFQMILNIKKQYKLGDLQGRALVIEWMILQNYKKKFSKEYLPLPGQTHPGLGVARLTFEILLRLAKRVDIDFVVASPEQFHLGVFYAFYFKFTNPKDHQMMQDLLRQFAPISINALSWLVFKGLLYSADAQEHLLWSPGQMIYNMKRLNAFELVGYHGKYEEMHHFLIDRDRVNRESKNLPEHILDEIKGYMQKHSEKILYRGKE